MWLLSARNLHESWPRNQASLNRDARMRNNVYLSPGLGHRDTASIDACFCIKWQKISTGHYSPIISTTCGPKNATHAGINLADAHSQSVYCVTYYMYIIYISIYVYNKYVYLMTYLHLFQQNVLICNQCIYDTYCRVIQLSWVVSLIDVKPSNYFQQHKKYWLNLGGNAKEIISVCRDR